MSNQFTYRKRKRARHLKHKILADRYNEYLQSGEYKKDFTTAMKRFIEEHDKDRF
jgi:hypothetical protein